MQKTIQIFEKKPHDFNAKVDVAASYIACRGKLLLLQLSERKEYAKQWGVPAGKFEQGETPEKALRRELFEETGISLTAHDFIQSIGQLYIRKPKIEYVYHPFAIELQNVPEIVLSDEHIAYRWVSIDEAKNLDLLVGAMEALHFYLSRKNALVN